MAQDDDRSVVVMGGSVLESVHDAVERRMQRRSGRERQVDADMDRTPLGSRAASGGVDQPRLVVSPGADRRAALGEPARTRRSAAGVLGRFACTSGLPAPISTGTGVVRRSRPIRGASVR